MRKINASQIAVFVILLLIAISLGITTTTILGEYVTSGDFRGIILFLCGLIFIYIYSILIYRLFLFIYPLQAGDIPPGSKAEFVVHVYFLFYLLVFNTLIRTHFIPVPLMRLVYQALGAKFGENSFCVGVILDPPLTHIGNNSIIGHDAVLFSHSIEGAHLALKPITIGNNVTIGAKSVIMAGVTIGDNAIVSAGAVVRKGTVIKTGELWGGVPAKLI